MIRPKPVTVDGALYVIIGVCTYISGTLMSDESYKYLNPWLLFWLKLGNGSVLAGAAALKMYRSTNFAQHQTDQRNNEQQRQLNEKTDQISDPPRQ